MGPTDVVHTGWPQIFNLQKKKPKKKNQHAVSAKRNTKHNKTRYVYNILAIKNTTDTTGKF